MAAIFNRFTDGFSQLSLRAKLTGGFLALILMIAFLDGLSLLGFFHLDNFDQRIDNEVRVADLCMASRDAIFEAQHDEKDFLMHQKEIGVPEARARYATLLPLRILTIAKNMAEIRSLSQDQEFIRQTEQIEQAVKSYESGFLKVVNLYEQLGLADSGLEGKFRQKAREIEAIALRQHNQPLTLALLTLRRNEKDYLRHNQDKYADRLRAEAARFREGVSQSGLPKGAVNQVAPLLADYLSLFNQYYAIQEQINQEIDTYRTTVNNLEPRLDELHDQAVQFKVAARDAEERYTRKALGIAIGAGSMAMIFGVLVSLLISRNLSRGVGDCLGFANRLAQGDLQARITPTGRDEFATLATALNHMADSLQEAQQTLEQQQQMLGEGNANLRGEISERQRAAESLRQTTEALQALINASPLAIFVLDSAGRVQRWNRASERIFGWTEEEALGRLLPIVPEEKQEEFQGLLQRVLGGESLPGVELTRRKKDGSPIEVSLYTAPLYDEQGQVTGVMSLVADITARQQMEETLRNQQAFSESVTESLPGMFYIFDDQGRPLQWNDNLEKVTGYSYEEITGMRPLEFIADEDRTRAVETIREVFLKGESTFEADVLTKDGRRTPYFFTGRRIMLEGKPCLLGVGIDITQRRQAEKALRESERNYRLLVKNIPAAVFKGYADWTVDCFGSKMQALTGYTKEDFDSRRVKWSDVVHPDDMEYVTRVFTEALKTTHSYVREHRILTKQKEVKWVQCRGQIVCDEAGKVEYVSGMTFDITERKQLEEERLRLSKLESLGLLAGGIAHDFNNILTAILGNISLAMMDFPPGDRRLERMLQAEKACMQAQSLARQLLTFAKGGAPVKELVSVAGTITESVDFACRGSQVRCESTFPDNLWPLEVDPGQIGQVFQNLIINAIQAMPTGGTIHIQAENLELGEPNDLSLLAGKYVKISIRDQGLGIPAEYISKIFDPYFTTKQKGSGLGLATAYSIIKNHDGHIMVTSSLGEGTTFHIYLPASTQTIQRQPEADRQWLAGKGKILVMDDEAIVREVLGKMLVNLGYEARFAQDGAEAIQLFTEARAAGDAFDAVILDLTVPGGMGGKESIIHLRLIDPQIKAIVSSGYSEDPIMADFQKYGFSGVIAKPYRVSDLSKTLHEVIIPEIRTN